VNSSSFPFGVIENSASQACPVGEAPAFITISCRHGFGFARAAAPDELTIEVEVFGIRPRQPDRIEPFLRVYSVRRARALWREHVDSPSFQPQTMLSRTSQPI
jgi:hypothetical protein